MLMFFIAIAAALAAILLYITAPKETAVHFARAKDTPQDVPTSRRSLAPFFVGPDGRFIDTAGKFVGYAHGSSGLPDVPPGATFVGDILDDAGRQGLCVGDLIVVDGVAKGSPISKRFRVIRAVDANKLYFESDRTNGEAHRPRPRAEAVAIVRFVQA